jgi:hypothetical protein
MNSATSKKVIDVKFTSNIGGFTFSTETFASLTTGFAFYAIEPEFTLRGDSGYTLCNAITISTTLLAL